MFPIQSTVDISNVSNIAVVHMKNPHISLFDFNIPDNYSIFVVYECGLRHNISISLDLDGMSIKRLYFIFQKGSIFNRVESIQSEYSDIAFYGNYKLDNLDFSHHSNKLWRCGILTIHNESIPKKEIHFDDCFAKTPIILKTNNDNDLTNMYSECVLYISSRRASIMTNFYIADVKTPPNFGILFNSTFFYKDDVKSPTLSNGNTLEKFNDNCILYDGKYSFCLHDGETGEYLKKVIPYMM